MCDLLLSWNVTSGKCSAQFDFTHTHVKSIFYIFGQADPLDKKTPWTRRPSFLMEADPLDRNNPLEKQTLCPDGSRPSVLMETVINVDVKAGKLALMCFTVEK